MIGSEIANTMHSQGDCQTKERDPCASPPCKRLKQSSIPFHIIIDDDGKQVNNTDKDSKVPTNGDNNMVSSNSIPMTVDNEQSDTNINDAEIDGQPTSNDIVLIDNKDNNSMNGILKFTTPGRKQFNNKNEGIPSKNMKSPLTPHNGTNTPSPVTSPDGTPTSLSKCQALKRQTPSHKLSVEEKLKREEEKAKKQQEKEKQHQERLEKKQEKERLKMEKEKERQELKQKKEQDKAEQQALKQQRDKERQEKKEQEDKERKEKQEKKEEEKRKKEDERKRKEDEKNLKNEEKRKKEEEETLKKQKAKNSFASFFIKKETTATVKKEQLKVESKFQPFELKPFMKLARTTAVRPLSLQARKALTDCMTTDQDVNMKVIKEELRKIKSEIEEESIVVNSTPVNENTDDDIMIVGDMETDTTEVIEKEIVKGVKAKLLQFHENYRPAYFGTWRKKSCHVRPRKPLGKDKDIIDYEVDSDEEWEEEEPGESLSNSEGEEEGDEDKEEGDGENDGFFVPHGYLSDDEGVEENQEEDKNEEKQETPVKPEDRIQRQMAKQKQWEVEMKRQFKPMKPISIGCLWNTDELPTVMKQLEACLLSTNTIDVLNETQETNNHPSTNISSNTTSYSNTAMPVPEEAMPALIKLVHGNSNGLLKLIQTFRKQWTLESKKDDSVCELNWEDHCLISKRQLERRITNIAKKEKRLFPPKATWFVDENVLTKYKMEDIRQPCLNDEQPSSSTIPPTTSAGAEHTATI